MVSLLLKRSAPLDCEIDTFTSQLHASDCLTENWCQTQGREFLLNDLNPDIVTHDLTFK